MSSSSVQFTFRVSAEGLPAIIVEARSVLDAIAAAGVPKGAHAGVERLAEGGVWRSCVMLPRR